MGEGEKGRRGEGDKLKFKEKEQDKNDSSVKSRKKQWRIKSVKEEPKNNKQGVNENNMYYLSLVLRPELLIYIIG
jgi:hypothetical protein